MTNHLLRKELGAMAGISGKAFVSVAANHPVLLTSSLTCVSPPLRRRSISRLTTPQTLICFHLRKTPQGRPRTSRHRMLSAQSRYPQVADNERDMAPQAGLEPATLRLTEPCPRFGQCGSVLFCSGFRARRCSGFRSVSVGSGATCLIVSQGSSSRSGHRTRNSAEK